MINGICYPCRLNQTKAASEYRIREKVNQNKLTSDQQMAHLLLDFKHVAIDPYIETIGNDRSNDGSNDGSNGNYERNQSMMENVEEMESKRIF